MSEATEDRKKFEQLIADPNSGLSNLSLSEQDIAFAAYQAGLKDAGDALVAQTPMADFANQLLSADITPKEFPEPDKPAFAHQSRPSGFSPELGDVVAQTPPSDMRGGTCLCSSGNSSRCPLHQASGVAQTPRLPCCGGNDGHLRNCTGVAQTSHPQPESDAKV